MSLHPELIIFFFIISLIYSSVGFGGGSSYLALLAMYEIPFKEMRLIALICNIIVVTGGTISFIRHKQLKWNKIFPLIILSIPMAYLGAKAKISAEVFFILLGCSLILASVLLWIQHPGAITATSGNSSQVKNAAIGGSIGLLSGMVGIGGGIFLSPVLNFLKWGTAKQVAAIASFFILVNSLSGIAGQLSDNVAVEFNLIVPLSIAVFAGGQIGSYLGIVKFNLKVIRRITALLVFCAGTEILIKHAI